MILIGIPLLVISFFSVTEMPSWLDFKPFNCNVCLSFWATVLAFIAMHFIPEIVEAICWGGVSAWVSIYAKRLIFKI